MRIDVKNLIKKPAVVSALAFVLIFAAVSTVAFSTNKPANDTVSNVEDFENIDNTLKFGYGLYIDGKYIAACKDEVVIRDTLSEVLASRVSGYEDVKVVSKAFTNLVEVKEGEYAADSFADGKSLLSLLGIESQSSYTSAVKVYGSDETVSLNVRVTAESIVNTVLESDVVYVDNANLLNTHDDIVISEGANGLTEDTYEYIYVNGECISKKFVSSVVAVEAVDRIIERGVLDEVRFNASSEETAVENSPFIMPYDGTYISSYYGWRSMGWHQGIDIIGGLGRPCHGDPVWAARDGVVIHASFNGNYGLVVMIRHEDGSETRYAHLSAVKVEVGEFVEQGQVIGNIGNTGFSTGAHLHFEIRINGETVDPLQYVRLYK